MAAAIAAPPRDRTEAPITIANVVPTTARPARASATILGTCEICTLAYPVWEVVAGDSAEATNGL